MSARFDAILLLGVALGENDQPTEELYARVREAAKVHKTFAHIKLIPCGGITPGHTRSEADVMTELLLAEGVPLKDIVRENESQTTIENFKNAARILGGKKARVLVVTSDYHVRRSVLTARRAGLRAKGHAAVLPHDAAWKEKKAKEFGYTVDMLMGWQDEGKNRPAWTYRLFDAVFNKRK